MLLVNMTLFGLLIFVLIIYSNHSFFIDKTILELLFSLRCEYKKVPKVPHKKIKKT